MTELDKVRLETVKFLRGKYKLDEVAGKYYEVDCLRFRQGKRTILSICFHPDRYDFQLIFGEAERAKFEELRDTFSAETQSIYDNSKTYADGKWMLIPVSDLKALEEVMRLITIKKKPNRKPFPQENALYSDCGTRCDLCVHYTGGTITEEFRKELKTRLTRVYKAPLWGDDMMLCPGCKLNTFKDFGGDPCDEKKCCYKKGLAACVDCREYPCEKATAGYKNLEPKDISADDVTWAILPYVPYQYER